MKAFSLRACGRILWREAAEQYTFCIGIFAMLVVMQASLATMETFDMIQPPTVAFGFGMALFMTAIYAAASSALLFTAEVDAGTFVFQRTKPIGWLTYLSGKLSWTVLSSIVLGLAAWIETSVWQGVFPDSTRHFPGIWRLRGRNSGRHGVGIDRDHGGSRTAARRDCRDRNGQSRGLGDGRRPPLGNGRRDGGCHHGLLPGSMASFDRRGGGFGGRCSAGESLVPHGAAARPGAAATIAARRNGLGGVARPVEFVWSALPRPLDPAALAGLASGPHAGRDLLGMLSRGVDLGRALLSRQDGSLQVSSTTLATYVHCLGGNCDSRFLVAVGRLHLRRGPEGAFPAVGSRRRFAMGNLAQPVGRHGGRLAASGDGRAWAAMAPDGADSELLLFRPLVVLLRRCSAISRPW